MSVGVGFTLQPEERYLALTAELLELVDYVEVTPETLWREDERGDLVANGFHAHFERVRDATRLPFVAHGVAFSLGSARPDPTRRARHLARVALDQAAFDFRWYTDHLGVTELASRSVTLPIALPLVPAAARAVRASLDAMRTVVRDTGCENSAFYYALGDPLAEPEFLRDALSHERSHLLLDLHNVWTNSTNLGFDAWSYVERLPLDKVIEIHVSGGVDSDPAWLPSGAKVRLDSHDAAVPEEVWALLERVLPLVPNLRGVTLERMEGTVEPNDVAILREELRRVRVLTEGRRAL